MAERRSPPTGGWRDVDRGEWSCRSGAAPGSASAPVYEYIHQALRQFAGIADHPFSKKFPLGVLEKETLHGLWG